jgi:hypothetical protein
MHLLIAFAAPLSAAGRQALSTLALPRLQALLAHSQEVERDADDECSLTPPHERALARALGLQGAPGRLPWAAWLAAADGLVTGDQAWGLLTPAHWHLGTEQVSLVDPHALALEEPESRALLQAIAPLFTSLGYALQFGAPLRWYLAHPSLATLATASPDRVIGRNIDAWLGTATALQAVRRLQSEVQMVLYTHPLNDQREAQGLLAVNSFWLSGCGQAQAAMGTEPTIDERLRAPALADDWAAWVKAWDTLDAGLLADLLQRAEGGDSVRLTLCGERNAATFEPAPRSLLQRARGLFAAPAVQPLLESL